MADTTGTPKQAETKAGPTADERIAALEAQLSRTQAMLPQTSVPTNSGGPGDGNHLPSWSLAAQEAANAGEWDETWGDEPK